jgi:spore maturation protein CgeB
VPRKPRSTAPATKINLNIHSANHVEGLDPDPDYVNPRTFELAACGAFQLVDARAPLAALFRDDELATFRSPAELRQKIAYYLAHPDERAAIAARGRARVLAEHTFAHRVQRIFAELLPAELQPQRPGAARGLAQAIDALERTSPKMTPDEAMMRVLQHVQQGEL